MPQNTRLFLIVLFLFSVVGISAYSQGVKVTFTPRSSLAFGNVVAGKTKDMVITVKNDSTSAALLTCTVTGPMRTDFSITGPSTFGVNVGDSNSLTIHFAPTAVLNYTDTIYISHNGDTTFNTKNPQRIRLTGAGTAPDTLPKISVNTGFGLNFGPVTIGKTMSRSFIIKNVTDTVRKLTGSIVTPVSSRYTIVSGGGDFSLDTGMIRTVTVNFTPDTIGFIFDSLFVTSNAAAPNNRIRVTLFGQGIKFDTFPHIAVTPGNRTVNFGTIAPGTTKTMSFTIRNSTDTARTLIGTVGSLSTSVYSILSGATSFALDSGKADTIQVTFKPIAPGQIRDSVLITTNTDSANHLIKMYFTGIGSGGPSIPKISVQPRNLRFDTTDIGSAPLQLTTTIGNVSDTVTDTLRGNVSNPRLPFTILTGGGPFLLLPNNALIVSVQFDPSAAGKFYDTVFITSNSDDATKNIRVFLSAVVLSNSVGDDGASKDFIVAIPNPFSNNTTIGFSLKNSQAVSMKVFDILGKQIYSIPESIYPAGIQQIQWNAAGMESGTYHCVLKIGKQTRSIKVILNK